MSPSPRGPSAGRWRGPLAGPLHDAALAWRGPWRHPVQVRLYLRTSGATFGRPAFPDDCFRSIRGELLNNSCGQPCLGTVRVCLGAPRRNDFLTGMSNLGGIVACGCRCHGITTKVHCKNRQLFFVSCLLREEVLE